MDRLLSMRVFERVADEGGFAAAARALDMSAPVVTRLVADLEEHIGSRLLQRTTRRLALTDAGQTYLLRVRNILQDIDEADAVARSHTTEVAGLLRLHAPPVLASYVIAPLLAEADFTFEFKEPANLPNPMLSMQNAYFGYPAPEDAPAGTPPTVIVQNVSKSVLAGQRIGILGANGQGKSTLVKTVARALAPIEGEMLEGKGLNIGYFAQQELDVLRPADNPLEHMIRLVKEVTAAGKISGQQTREQDLRSFLGNFNFGGDMVKQTVGSMSGGEKARLVLCMIVWQRPNLLLLDEPTNHLDLATREALSMALNEFEGTVMLVSHDRALLRAVCDEFWMVSHGGVAPFDGDLDDYQRYLLDEAKRQRDVAKKSANVAATQAATAVKAAAATPKSSDIVKPLKKELDKVDQQMKALTAERLPLEATLAALPVAADMAQAGKRLKAVDAELQQLEERWLELTDQIETA